MRDCANVDMRDLLPDLLHDRLAPELRARAAAHLAECESCREELALLRRARAVTAPAAASIDVTAVAAAVRAELAQLARPVAPGASRRDGSAAPQPRWVRAPRSSLPRWARSVRARVTAGVAVALLAFVALLNRDEPGDVASDAVAVDALTQDAPTLLAESTGRVPLSGRPSPQPRDPALGSTFADLTDAELAAVVDAVSAADAALPSADPMSAASFIDLDGALE